MVKNLLSPQAGRGRARVILTEAQDTGKSAPEEKLG
jgi:hypothetical protein